LWLYRKDDNLFEEFGFFYRHFPFDFLNRLILVQNGHSYPSSDSEYVCSAKSPSTLTLREPACGFDSTGFLASLLIENELFPEKQILSNQLAPAAHEEKKK